MPAWCEIELDRRTIPGETAEQVAGELRAVAERVTARDPRVRAELLATSFEAACEVDPAAPVVLAAGAALGDLGLDAATLGMPGATDARILIHEAGVPAVVLGPGDLALAHSTAERIPLADLVTAARVYARLYARFLAPTRA